MLHDPEHADAYFNMALMHQEHAAAGTSIGNSSGFDTDCADGSLSAQENSSSSSVEEKPEAVVAGDGGGGVVHWGDDDADTEDEDSQDEEAKDGNAVSVSDKPKSDMGTPSKLPSSPSRPPGNGYAVYNNNKQSMSPNKIKLIELTKALRCYQAIEAIQDSSKVDPVVLEEVKASIVSVREQIASIRNDENSINNSIKS